MPNSKPQNYDRLRKLPRNCCYICGELLGDFHPTNGGILWLDLATHQHLGWVCPKGCGVDELDDDDFDESIAD